MATAYFVPTINFMHSNIISQLKRLAFFAQFKLLFAVVPTSLISGCASFDQSTALTTDMHTTLQQLATQRGVCGVAIAIIKNRKFDSVDTASGCSSAIALSADSVFQAASLSKPVFAYAVLKLVAQGKLDLDTPVLQYLPQGYVHAARPFLSSSPTDLVKDLRLQSVTVRMALNHTSGLPNWANGPLAFDLNPGTEWRYSGEGYVLLQRAVEAVTSIPLDQFMREQVFKPLGMVHSDFIWSTRIARQFVPVTTRSGTTKQPLQLMAPVAAFSLYTSAQDYGKFLATVLNEQSTLEKITRTSVLVSPELNLRWGLGWGVENSASDAFLWHWGNNPGYRAFVMASTQTGDGLVMLTNSDNGLTLAEPLTRQVLPGKHAAFRFYMLGLDSWFCKAMNICS